LFVFYCYLLIYSSEDVNNLIAGKLALKYAGREVESMKSIAEASQKRSLADFQKVVFIIKFNFVILKYKFGF
jgi:26S proteasome regulatory subunit N6